MGILPFSTVFAQNGAKWAIGPDLYGLINKNVLPKYSLFVRYRLSDNGAVRLRAGYYNVKMQAVLYDTVEEKDYAIRVGYEATKAIYKQSLFLLYGVEYIYSHDYTFQFSYSNPIPVNTSILLKHTENGGAAFLGARYFLLPALSLSTESSFQVTRTFIRRAQLGQYEETNNFTSVLLHPITSFNLCFHF